MVKLRLDGIDAQAAKNPELLKTGIDSILTAIDNSLSGYNPSSLLTRFNAGETIVPDAIFTEMYELSHKFHELTDGAFDVAAGPLFDAWGFGFKDGDIPTDNDIAEILDTCGMDRLKGDISETVGEDGRLNPSDLLIDAQTALPQLNFNAIAQGYSCDLVARWLRSKGVTNMLIMLGGGEIYSEGLNPSGKPWTIGVDKPFDGNNMPGAELEGRLIMDGKPCGIATSGNYRKFYIRDGKKYAHTIDPRTGRPVEHNLLSATIISPDATTADVLATYCMVIGLEASQDFITATEGVEGYLIYDSTENSSANPEPTAADQDKTSENHFKIWQSEGVTLNQ